MDGLWVREAGGVNRRPKSKKEVRAAVAQGAENVTIEFTSFFAVPRQSTAADLRVGERIDFVGPDPHTNRKFYGTIRRTSKGWSVK